MVTSFLGRTASRAWAGGTSEQFDAALAVIIADALDQGLAVVPEQAREALLAAVQYERVGLPSALDADETTADALRSSIDALIRPMDENEVDGVGHLTSLGLDVEDLVATVAENAIVAIRRRGLRGDAQFGPLAVALEPPPAADHGPVVQDGLRSSTAWFRGRQREVGQIEALLTARTGVAMVNIVGMPAVGKSALADEVAAHLAHRFVRRLTVTLPAGVDHASYLFDRVIEAFGNGPGALLASGPPVLLVLDDIRLGQDLAWVAHLPVGSAVIATSWSPQLPGAVAVRIGGVDEQDAIAILLARSGREDVEGVDEVVVACRGLPLALAIIGGLLGRRPTWSWTDVGSRLGEHSIAVMDGYAAPERGLSTVFSLCYQELLPAEAKVFRLLGLLPTPTIDVRLAGEALDRALGLRDPVATIESIADLALLEHDRPGQVVMHGLVAQFARDRLADEGDLEEARSFEANFLSTQLDDAAEIVRRLRWET
jgi:hypothetical protein